MTGQFIAFEGGEGSGKSTQCRLFAQGLTEAGRDVVLTREPGGCPEAERIRGLVVSGDSEWDPLTETMLFAAARREHLIKKVSPALLAGQTVVTDRFVGSTIALQGTKGVSADEITQMHASMCFGLYPDLTVVLDMPADQGLARALARCAGQTVQEDRFERLGVAYHTRVRESFLAQAAAAPHRHVVVSALGTVEEVQARLTQAVQAFQG